MTNISELKDAIDTKTVNFSLLAIATGGIYPILWLYKNSPIIEGVTKKKVADNTFTIWLAICVGFGVPLFGTGEEALDLIVRRLP